MHDKRFRLWVRLCWTETRERSSAKMCAKVENSAIVEHEAMLESLRQMLHEWRRFARLIKIVYWPSSNVFMLLFLRMTLATIFCIREVLSKSNAHVNVYTSFASSHHNRMKFQNHKSISMKPDMGSFVVRRCGIWLIRLAFNRTSTLLFDLFGHLQSPLEICHSLIVLVRQTPCNINMNRTINGRKPKTIEHVNLNDLMHDWCSVFVLSAGGTRDRPE